jgi:hypothetical protein
MISHYDHVFAVLVNKHYHRGSNWQNKQTYTPIFLHTISLPYYNALPPKFSLLTHTKFLMPDDSPEQETHDHNGISEWCVVQETKRFAKSKSWIIFRVVNVYFNFFCDNRISYKGIFYIIVIYKREYPWQSCSTTNLDCGTFFSEGSKIVSNNSRNLCRDCVYVWICGGVPHGQQQWSPTHINFDT